MAKTNKPKKLRGGSVVETVGNFVYKGTLLIAFLMMLIVPLIFLGLLVCIYFLMNAVLSGTNQVIHIINDVIVRPVVLPIIKIINGIIKGINALSGG